MRVMLFVLLSFTLFVIACTQPPPDERTWWYCRETFEQEGACPENWCQPGCGQGGLLDEVLGIGGCSLGCEPRPPSEFTVRDCPPFYIVKLTCAGEEVCTYGPLSGDGCGIEGNAMLECCEGLSARCGRMDEGICNASAGVGGKDYPVCLACGDGVCAGLEDACNCPEDCIIA